MAVPSTRVPKIIRDDVRKALDCWRDYLIAIGNPNGASLAADVVLALGLEPLPAVKGVNRFDHANWQLKRMLENVERYGAR